MRAATPTATALWWTRTTPTSSTLLPPTHHPCLRVRIRQKKKPKKTPKKTPKKPRKHPKKIWQKPQQNPKKTQNHIRVPEILRKSFRVSSPPPPSHDPSDHGCLFWGSGKSSAQTPWESCSAVARSVCHQTLRCPQHKQIISPAGLPSVAGAGGGWGAHLQHGWGWGGWERHPQVPPPPSRTAGIGL